MENASSTEDDISPTLSDDHRKPSTPRGRAYIKQLLARSREIRESQSGLNKWRAEREQLEERLKNLNKKPEEIAVVEEVETIEKIDEEKGVEEADRTYPKESFFYPPAGLLESKQNSVPKSISVRQPSQRVAPTSKTSPNLENIKLEQEGIQSKIHNLIQLYESSLPEFNTVTQISDGKINHSPSNTHKNTEIHSLSNVKTPPQDISSPSEFFDYEVTKSKSMSGNKSLEKSDHPRISEPVPSEHHKRQNDNLPLKIKEARKQIQHSENADNVLILLDSLSSAKSEDDISNCVAQFQQISKSNSFRGIKSGFPHLNETQRSKLAQKIREIDELRSQLADQQSKVTGETKQIMQLRDSVTTLSSENERLKSTVAKQHDDSVKSDELSGDLSRRERELNQKEAEMESVRARIRETEDKLKESEEKIEKRRNELDSKIGLFEVSINSRQQELDAEMKSVRTERSELQLRRTQLEPEEAKVQRQLRKLESEQMEFERQSVKLRQERTDMEVDRRQIKLDTAEIRRQSEALQNQKLKLSQSEDKLETERAQLEKIQSKIHKKSSKIASKKSSKIASKKSGVSRSRKHSKSERKKSTFEIESDLFEKDLADERSRLQKISLKLDEEKSEFEEKISEFKSSENANQRKDDVSGYATSPSYRSEYSYSPKTRLHNYAKPLPVRNLERSLSHNQQPDHNLASSQSFHYSPRTWTPLYKGAEQPHSQILSDAFTRPAERQPHSSVLSGSYVPGVQAHSPVISESHIPRVQAHS
eukprot:947599_1